MKINADRLHLIDSTDYKNIMRTLLVGDSV